jgi:hypothetical protein
VQVSFGASAEDCEVDSQPQAIDRVGYRFVLRGTDEDGTERETEPKDWCRRFTYTWLDAHLNLTRAVNDISREHGGLFLPHKSHRFGYDIDMFHPQPVLAAGTSGTANYLALAAMARQATIGDPESIALLHNWYVLTRQWLDQALADPDISKLGYLYGLGDSWLRHGWALELLSTGAYVGPVPEIRTIDLGIGLWANRGNRKLFSMTCTTITYTSGSDRRRENGQPAYRVARGGERRLRRQGQTDAVVLGHFSRTVTRALHCGISGHADLGRGSVRSRGRVR